MHMCILTLCITLHPLESLSAVNQPVDNPWSALFFRNKFTSTVIFSSQCVIFILLKQTGCCTLLTRIFMNVSRPWTCTYILYPFPRCYRTSFIIMLTQRKIQSRIFLLFSQFPKLGFFIGKYVVGLLHCLNYLLQIRREHGYH